MAAVTVQTWISPDLKKQADALFAALGLATPEAIRLFLLQAVNMGGQSPIANHL